MKKILFLIMLLIPVLPFAGCDITYCPQDNTIAIFFVQTSNSNLKMHVIPMVKITSDLSVLDDMDSRVEMVFDVEK